MILSVARAKDLIKNIFVKIVYNHISVVNCNSI